MVHSLEGIFCPGHCFHFQILQCRKASFFLLLSPCLTASAQLGRDWHCRNGTRLWMADPRRWHAIYAKPSPRELRHGFVSSGSVLGFFLLSALPLYGKMVKIINLDLFKIRKEVKA